MKKLFFFILLFLITSLFCSFLTSAHAAFISNADIDDEDMADISDWVDGDYGATESTQVTFDGKSCMKLDSVTEKVDAASRYQDVGTFGTRTVISFSAYFDDIGTFANYDIFNFLAWDGSTGLNARFCTDGLFILGFVGGAHWTEVGTDLVSEDTWQEWTFDVDWTAQTTDVYLNQNLVASDVDCSWSTATDNGTIRFSVFGSVADNQITYVDWEKAGSDFVLDVSRRIIFIQ